MREVQSEIHNSDDHALAAAGPQAVVRRIARHDLPLRQLEKRLDSPGRFHGEHTILFPQEFNLALTSAYAGGHERIRLFVRWTDYCDNTLDPLQGLELRKVCDFRDHGHLIIGT